MKCDGSPDPTIPGEINTYINLLREDHSGDDIDSVMKESKLILAVSTIQPHYNDSKGTEGRPSTFLNIDTSFRTFNCTLLTTMDVGDLR